MVWIHITVIDLAHVERALAVHGGSILIRNDLE